jgi:hypothetical protein
MAISRVHDRPFLAPGLVPSSLDRWRARDRWIEGWMRFGQLARAFVYLIPGALALRLAIDSQGASVSQTKAIAALGRQPLGNVLIFVLAVGLAGYALWGFYRALLDPLERGRSVGGLLIRLGYLISGLAYASFLWFALRLMTGDRPDDAATQAWIGRALSHRFGSWAVVAVGAGWILAGGLLQLWMALRTGFLRELDLSRTGPAEHALARHLGRIGLAARAIVFALIGFSIVGAGLHLDPKESQDLGGALWKLLQGPYGRPLLIVVASGLIAFGAYSILCVRWARLRAVDPSARVAVPARTS